MVKYMLWDTKYSLRRRGLLRFFINGDIKMKDYEKLLKEEFVERKDIYDGKVLHVVCDTVLLPNGERATREMCLHVGACCVIPLFEDGTVLMERQYRYPVGRVLLEIPAGKLNYKEEDPLEAAKRELREETGAVAERYTYLGEFIGSAALIDERIQMYLAEGLSFVEQELDDDEFLELERIPLRELYGMVMRGEIADAKTQVAVLKAWQLRGSR